MISVVSNMSLQTRSADAALILHVTINFNHVQTLGFTIDFNQQPLMCNSIDSCLHRVLCSPM